MGEQLYKEIGHLITDRHHTTSGQLFGKACLKYDKKVFAAFYQNEMVFKLGLQEIILLKEKFIRSIN